MGADRTASKKSLSNKRGNKTGAYYKARYGGSKTFRNRFIAEDSVLDNELSKKLARLDGQQYGAYKQLAGQWFGFERFSLYFDFIQADAYAAPSRIRVRVNQNEVAKFPVKLYSNSHRMIATVHYLARNVNSTLQRLQNGLKQGGDRDWKSLKGGFLAIDVPGQEVIERTSIVINDSFVEARLTASMPATGRTIIGSVAQQMLCGILPKLVDQAMLNASIDGAEMQSFVDQIEDQAALRQQLESCNLVAFVGDGAVLPRATGISSLKLIGPTVVPFKAPENMRVSFTLPNRGTVTGMGIRRGITLICGGGFNGKSTLLQAVELGVYNHVPGDGRELVATTETAVKVKAEEGRYVSGVDIRPFINNLPFINDTANFSTTNASGSTSMAASIQEALEAHASVLLFDEDTCATNFLIRDKRMQNLVLQKNEPITPLISRIRELWESKGISSILVVGGCGDYLDVADTVIDMCQYVATDSTAQAKKIAQQYPVSVEVAPKPYGAIPMRHISIPKELVGYKGPSSKGLSNITFRPSRQLESAMEKNDDDKTEGYDVSSHTDRENSELDLSALDQLVSASQTRSIAQIIQMVAESSTAKSMRKWLECIDKKGLDELAGKNQGNLARPRPIEVAMAINRLRFAHTE